MSFTISFNTSSIIKFTKPITATISILIVTGGATTTSIATSFSDGASWNYQSGNIFTKGRDIATNNTIFLAVGEGTNTIATSTDGLIWNGQGKTDFSTAGHKAIWDGSKWILAGQGTNTLLYGTTGTSWTGVVSSPFTTAAYGLLYDSAAGKYFAVGSGTNHTLATSTDGTSWTGAGNNFVSGNAYTIHGPAASTAADPSYTWIAVGTSNTTGNIIGYSESTTTWSSLYTPTKVCYAIEYGNGKWIAGAISPNNLIVSPNNTGGGTWTETNNGSGHNFAVKYANGLWVTGGWGGGSAPHMRYSINNGVNWGNCTPETGSGLLTNIFNTECWGINYANGTWIAVGDTNNTNTANTIVKSLNGKSWIGVDKVFNNVYSVAYGNGYWAAGGLGGIRYSANNGNLNTWSTVTLAASTVRAISYGSYGSNAEGNGRWVILRTHASNPIMYANAYPTSTWLSPNSFPSGLLNITSEMGLSTDGNGKWIGCIGGQIIQSLDNAVTWITGNTSINPARAVKYRSNKKPKYVVGGTGNSLMMGSDDGTTWYEITDQPFSVAVNDVKWNGSIWLAGGEGYWKLAYSNNGSNWIGIDQTIFTTRVNKVHWNSRVSKWYAAGEGGNTFASGSADALTWTKITAPVNDVGLGILTK